MLRLLCFLMLRERRWVNNFGRLRDSFFKPTANLSLLQTDSQFASFLECTANLPLLSRVLLSVSLKQSPLNYYHISITTANAPPNQFGYLCLPSSILQLTSLPAPPAGPMGGLLPPLPLSRPIPAIVTSHLRHWGRH